MQEIIPIDVEYSEIKNIKDEEVSVDIKKVNPIDVIQLRNVVDDYNKLRDVVLENVSQLKTITSNISEEMEINGYDPEMVASYGKLVETSNKSLKILTDSYKSISDILINIAKINTLHKKPEKDDKTKVEAISTFEILNRLRNNN